MLCAIKQCPTLNNNSVTHIKTHTQILHFLKSQNMKNIILKSNYMGTMSPNKHTILGSSFTLNLIMETKIY